MLTGAWDGTVKLWVIKSGGLSSVPLTEYYDHDNAVVAVSLTSNAKFCAAGAEDGKIIVWENTGAEVLTYPVSQGLKYVPLH